MANPALTPGVFTGNLNLLPPDSETTPTVSLVVRLAALASCGAVMLGATASARGGVVVNRIQAPQVISGPNNRSDMPYVGVRIGSELSVYTANAYTYNMRGKGARSLAEAYDFYGDSSATLGPGNPGNWDDGGAWLHHVEVDPEPGRLIRGWYHAEKVRPGQLPLKTIAYCESADGGRTFRKVCTEDPAKNYPSNQILSAWSGFAADPNQDQAGDGRIVRVGTATPRQPRSCTLTAVA